VTEENSVTVPIELIEADTLRALIEEFVTRDGTDYGAVETPLSHRVQQVSRWLTKGDALVVYNPQTDSVSIVLKEML
jgi:uncharacterized protein